MYCALTTVVDRIFKRVSRLTRKFTRRFTFGRMTIIFVTAHHIEVSV